MSDLDTSPVTDFEWALDLLAPLPQTFYRQAPALRRRLLQLLMAVHDAGRAGLKPLPYFDISRDPLTPHVMIGDETIEFVQVGERWGYRVLHKQSGRGPFVEKPEGVDLFGWAVEITRGAMARLIGGTS